jgi:hypothetical protein
MSLAHSFMATTAICLSLFATTAAADLKAQDVWGDWRAYIEGMGYAVAATEKANGDTLAVNDIIVTSIATADTGPMTIRLGSFQFVSNRDGSVDLVMPSSMPMTIDIAAQGLNPATQVELLYTQSGQQMTARGDAAALAYDYSADTFGLALTSLTVDGDAMSSDTARFSLNGSALTSMTNVTVADQRNYAQNMQIGSVVYDMFFKEPKGVEAMSINSTLNDLSFSGSSTLPKDALPMTQDLTPMLAAGFAFDGAFDANGTETLVEITSEDGTSKLKTGSASSTLAVAMGADGIQYDVSADQVQMGGQLAGLPFPLFVEMAKYGVALRAPVTKSDDPQDFKLAFNMTEFTMSDIIWALFDASGQLPRDPATIALDLSGKAKLLVDGLSSKNAQEIAATGAAPAEVNALKIDRLLVDALGAKVEATGDITFDNTDTTTMAGFPKPVGDININIAGANGLMDKLTAMGMLPAQQATGARMMMGMFAVPGSAPDTLQSKIEFNEAGQILANGQRIK